MYIKCASQITVANNRNHYANHQMGYVSGASSNVQTQISTALQSALDDRKQSINRCTNFYWNCCENNQGYDGWSQ